MSGEIKIRERVSEYRCYVLDDFSEDGLGAFVAWVKKVTSQSCSLSFRKQLVLPCTAPIEERSLFLEMSTDGDYPHRSSITITEEPIYAVAGHDWVDFRTREQVGEEFEIIEEEQERKEECLPIIRLRND